MIGRHRGRNPGILEFGLVMVELTGATQRAQMVALSTNSLTHCCACSNPKAGHTFINHSRSQTQMGDGNIGNDCKKHSYLVLKYALKRHFLCPEIKDQPNKMKVMIRI